MGVSKTKKNTYNLTEGHHTYVNAFFVSKRIKNIICSYDNLPVYTVIKIISGEQVHG